MTKQEKAIILSWLQLCRDSEQYYKDMHDNNEPGLFDIEITQAIVDEMSAKRAMMEAICNELKIQEA